MSKFYTNVAKYGDKLLVRGYKDGIQFRDKVDYTPTLYVQDGNQNSDSNIKTLDGKKVKPIHFESMSESKKFLDKYKDVSGFNIYGNSAFPYQYISDTYSKDVPWDPEHITTYSIDIETSVEFGFPENRNPREEILLITIHNKKSNRYRVFTFKKFTTSRKNVDMMYCNDERDMLRRFTEFMYNNPPDIITGWNTKFFDIPYLCARIDRVLDGDEAYKKRLSPWGVVWSREVNVAGRVHTTYDLLGVASLDYLDLYKKYIKTPRENYKLGYIGEVELGLPKIENPYPTFKAFYSNDWDLFVEYNIRDVEIVDQLEDKLKLIELQMTTAYMSKVNYEDIFGQVKVWETIIYNHLRKKNIVVKADREVSRASSFDGAYVKPPIVGKHRNIASFDLDSLYPHLIINYNMSPETLINNFTEYRDIASVDSFLDKKIDTSKAKQLGYSVAANGVCFDNSKQGFLPELMATMYADRKAYKKKMLAKEQEYQTNPSKELAKEIAKLHNLQLALKINLNSAYGALGNVAFKYFDIRLAEGITHSGQLSIRWIANKFNLALNKICEVQKDRVLAADTDSVLGSTEICVNGHRLTIEDYYNSIDNNFIKKDTFNENYVKLITNGDLTKSVSSDGILRNNKINYVMKHKVKKQFFKITNKNGKSIVVTEDHSVIVKDKTTNRIHSIKPDKLNVELHYIINIIDTDSIIGASNAEEDNQH